MATSCITISQFWDILHTINHKCILIEKCNLGVLLYDHMAYFQILSCMLL